MDTLVGIVMALATLALTVYVHRKIPVFTNSRRKVLFTSIILSAVGVAFGMVSTLYVAESAQKLLAFLTGFGIVHLPAAVILFVKSKRGERKS